MKALKRGIGETVRETDGVVGIDWTNGEPLTRPGWAGGPYTLVDNYTEYSNGEVTFEDPAVPLEVVEEPKPEEPLIELNGKLYTKQELRDLLG